MASIAELLTPQELVDYTKTRTYEGTMGDVLFPPRKTEALEIKIVKGASNLPVSAKVHSFDVEAEIASRDGGDVMLQDLALIKRKIPLSERDIIALESPRNSREETEMIQRIFNDADNLVQSVLTRVEAMRMEALSTGIIAVNENGITASINYGMPTNHKFAKTWKSGTPTILDDMDAGVNQIVKDTGFTPTRALTSKTILHTMLRDPSIRAAVFGVNSAKMLTVAELNTFLAQQSLPQIAVYDKMFRQQDKKGNYTSVRFLDESKFIMMPDGKLGDTFFGVTAEELELRRDPSVDVSSVGNVIVCHYSTVDPVARWLKAVATAMPSFPYADQVAVFTIS
jgi:hypothetical protein